MLALPAATRHLRDPEFAAVRRPSIPPVPQGNGSIYQAGFERSWFENIRARRVGDILLVNLVEDTEASQTPAPSKSPQQPRSLRRRVRARQQAVRSTWIRASTGASFSGDADNTQNNAVQRFGHRGRDRGAANGYLRVSGEKRIGMTGGNEYIRVSGIVRPEDIDLRNTSIDPSPTPR